VTTEPFVKQLLSKLFGWPGKTAQQTRPGRSCPPALEPLEARDVPVVGAFALPPVVPVGGGFDGVVRVMLLGNTIGTGTLLSDGRHVLTAAHVLTDSSTSNAVNNGAVIQVEFTVPEGHHRTIDYDVTPDHYHIHPGWDGNPLHGNDLALMELPFLAPIDAERRDIYRGTDEVGQFFQVVGYGQTGTGDEGATTHDPNPDKRLGVNDFDDAQVLSYLPADPPRHGFQVDPTAGQLLKFEFDSVQHEDFVAHGDSGGPDLLGGRIAGVNSFVRETTAASVLLSGDFESQFGESAYSARVSSFASWIDSLTTGPQPLVIDMTKQPDGDDGIRDTIDVRVTNGNLEVRVNGRLYDSEPVANVSSLEIDGSTDSEDFVTSGPLGMNVILDAKVGMGAQPQTLTVLGTSGADNVIVDPVQVTFGGHTITFKGDERIVNTLGGNDVITLDGPSLDPLHVIGGEGVDTLIGPNGGNHWFLKGTNGGTLTPVLSFAEETFADVENLQGGPAGDAFIFGLGSVTGTVDGGGGSGILDYTTVFGPVTVDLQNGTASFVGGGFSNITRVIGSASGNDALIGRNVSTVWTLTALNAGQINGSALQSALSFSGFENLAGGTASDTFQFTDAGGVSGTLSGGGKGVVLPGGTSVDTLDYSLRTTGVVVDLTRGLIPGVGKAVGFEGVIGTPKDDLLRGDAGNNILQGGGGFDILIGEDGNDELIASGAGRSILIGGRGRDLLVGGGVPSDPLNPKLNNSGSDLLIGGLTDFDDNDLALTAIMNEWRRSDLTYAQRVQDLRTGVPVGAGVVAQLTTTTVHDDGAVDKMTGQGGDDWFWGLAAEVTDRSKLFSQPGTLEFIN
jgi:hypothetical protein